MNEIAHQLPTPVEDRIVDPIRLWLEVKGYQVENRHRTGKPGPDIIARHPARRTWFIAARGGGAVALRAADPQSRQEMADHLARVFLAAACCDDDTGAARRAVALPRSALTQDLMLACVPALTALDICVIWVEPSGAVTLEGPRVPHKGLRPEELNASNDD